MHSMRDDRDHPARRALETATRMVMDAHGNEWIIREVDTPQTWAHGDRCLIFSSPSIVRREEPRASSSASTETPWRSATAVRVSPSRTV